MGEQRPVGPRRGHGCLAPIRHGVRATEVAAQTRPCVVSQNGPLDADPRRDLAPARFAAFRVRYLVPRAGNSDDNSGAQLHARGVVVVADTTAVSAPPPPGERTPGSPDLFAQFRARDTSAPRREFRR
jgi:hypothetical protein